MQVDMSKYDPLFDNIEEYVNKQGATFGEEADVIEGIAHSIAYLYIHGIATESQAQSMNKKLVKKLKENIRVMEN